MARIVTLLGKFQCKGWDFGFVIPDDRADWGGDFFVHKNNFAWATDNQRVRAEVMDRVSGKKPEAKIIEVFSGKTQKVEKPTLKAIEGIFSGGNGDFWFIDVPGQEDGYFCYGLKKNGAKDGDRVRADIKKYNGKDEAIVTEILEADTQEAIEWVYSDNIKFGFVKPDDKSQDVFIAGSRKQDAKTWDRVSCRIVKQWGRRREGIIEKIL